MKSSTIIGMEYYILGPIVLVLVAASLWVSAMAVLENYHLGRATDQIIRIVTLSRELRINPKDSEERAADAFFNQANLIKGLGVTQFAPSFLGKPAERGFINPWGKNLRVFFYPSVKSVRIETLLSAVACRRILLLYANDVDALGLRRVDVKPNDVLSSWRLVYEELRGAKMHVLDQSAIIAGCGDFDNTLLSLTFYL